MAAAKKMTVPRRLVVLGLFCIFTASSAIQWITFSPIESEARNFFGITTNQLNMLSSIFMITFVVLGPAASTSFETLGVRRSLIIGTFFNALGAAMKVFIASFFPSFATIMAAQFVASIGQLALLSTPPLIASMWFEPKQRTVATSIASNANNLGTAIGMFLPPMLISDSRQDRGDFLLLFGLEFAICVLVAVLIFFGVPDHPTDEEEGEIRHHLDKPRQTSTDENIVSHHKNQSPISQFRAQFVAVLRAMVSVMIKIPSFTMLLTSFSVSMGTVWTFSSVLAQVLDPFGVPESLAGAMGAANICVGTAAAVFVSWYVDTARRYKKPLLACCFANSLCISCLLLVVTHVQINSTAMNTACFVVYVFAGVSQLSTIPICFEYALELSFPIMESVPGILLMVGANFAALVLLTISSSMMGSSKVSAEEAVQVLYFLLAASVSGGLCALLPGEDLKRLENERRQQGGADEQRST